jgi:hypothetical protein
MTRDELGVDARYAYLAFLAFRMFSRHVSVLADEEIREAHEEYRERYMLRVSEKTMMDPVVECGMVRRTDGVVSFEYRYIYYYFVARYLRDNPNVVPSTARELTREIFREENASILMFLCYLTKDETVISAICQRASELFAEAKPLDLDSKGALFELPCDIGVRFTLPEGDPAENRARMLNAMDDVGRGTVDHADEPVATTRGGVARGGDSVAAAAAAAEDEDGAREKVADLHELSRTLNAATKTIEVLGQVVRNFAGSLEGGDKLRLTRECYGLGLRACEAVMDRGRRNCEYIVRSFQRVFVEKGLAEDVAKDRAQNLLFWFMEVWCHGMFGLVADAVGLEVLEEVYRRIREETDVLSIAFLDLRIRLNHFDTFPESVVLGLEERTRKKPFARTLLRLAVWQHFYLYRENYKIRQRVCDKLEIKLPGVPALGR